MILNDIRLRRTLEEIFFPPGKPDGRPRSLGFLRMALADKSRSVLFATFPKSGWNWAGDILGYCLVKKHLGKYEIKYEGEGTLKERQRKPFALFNPADSRAWNIARISDTFPAVGVDYCLHTHEHWKYAPLWGLDQARTVFIVRNIPTNLFSYYKSRAWQYQSFEDCLLKGALDRVLLFHNSWGEFASRRGSVFRIFKYEDMRRSPTESFASMYEFVFKESIEPAILGEALDYFSFENQKKREYQFEKDESKHFHFKGATDYSDQMSPETKSMILARLSKDLKHTFGYNYDH